jgi:Ca2+-binding RTX toxin-like protein
MSIVRGTDGNDVKDGTEAPDIMNGFGGDDELHGKGGNDNINGDAGNDQLFGDDGNDLLDGGLDEGADKDTLDGGIGIDTASYSQVQHKMTIDLVKGTAVGLDLNNTDTLVSIENLTGTNFADELVGDGAANLIQGADGADEINGAGGADRLSGNGGNDTLNGGANADTLIGSLGVDKLTGGSGADLFQYFGFASLTSPGDSGVGLGKRDVVTDFQHGVDKLDLQIIDAKAGTAGSQGFSFIGKDTFTAEGQVRFFFEGDHTVVALNTSGTSGAEAQIELTDLVNVSGGDFLL